MLARPDFSLTWGHEILSQYEMGALTEYQKLSHFILKMAALKYLQFVDMVC